MLGLAEMRYRKGQFVIIAVIVGLVAYLALMMGGIGAALLDPGAIKRFDADLLVFAGGSRLGFGESELPAETVAAIAAAPGVSASAPAGFFVVRPVGSSTTAALVGVEPGSIAAPPVTAGRALRPGERGVLLADRALLDATDLAVGDRVTLPSRLATTEFEIVGAVDQGPFALQPVVYASLEDWRQLRYGATAGVPAASFVLVQGDDGVAALRESLAAAAPGVEAGTAAQVFDGIEGVSGIRNSIGAVVWFGLGVGALVVGAFFYVLTVQKVGQIGVLKAVGASSWFVSRQLLAQVLVIVAAGLALAFGAGLATADLLANVDIPIRFTAGNMVLTVVVLTAFALVAAGVSARRILRVDPLIALGQQQ